MILDDVLADDPRIAAAAGGLRARGVQRGDIVSWRMPNGDVPMLLYRACWRIGAVAAPVHHLGDMAPPGVVVEDLPDGPPVQLSEAQPDDLAVMLFTSGSSGAPKAVLHNHRALAYKSQLMVEIHGLRSDDAVLMPAPMAHISGLLNGVLVAGVVPFRAVFMAKWDPEEAAALIERERITYMVGPPTFFVDLMRVPRTPPRGLRLISSGGAGVTPAFCAEATELLGARVKRAYGSTEAPTMTTSREHDPVERGWQTDGRPVGAVEVRLGPSDELWVRGPELFVGYADAAQTAAVMTDGWFRTGDTASIDADGWVTITGRLGAVIIRGGENISASEIEGLLERHPYVHQAVALGYPDERLGERVAAVVVADETFDLAACQAWFADLGVARFKTPERVVRVDAMPTLPAGKPDRAAMSRLLA